MLQGKAKEIYDKLNTILGPEDVLFEIGYRIDGLQQVGEILKAFCPIHKEKVIRTLNINTAKKTYRCSYTSCPGKHGGGLIDLYSLAKKIDLAEAVKFWARKLGLNITPEIYQELKKETVLADKTKKKVSAVPEENKKEVTETENGEEILSAEEYARRAQALQKQQKHLEEEKLKRLLEIEKAAEAEKTPITSLDKNKEEEKPVAETARPAITSPKEESKVNENKAIAPEAEKPPEKEALPAEASAYEKALANFELNKYNTAISLFKEALEHTKTEDEKGTCLLMVGRCLLEENKFEEAFSQLEEALAGIKPEQAIYKEILYYQGLVKYRQNDKKGAYKIFHHLQEQFGNYRDVGEILQHINGLTHEIPASSTNIDDRIAYV